MITKRFFFDGIIIVLVLWVSTATQAQITQVSELWLARYNGPGDENEIANAIDVDDEDNVYITGGSATPDGERSFTTIKYDTDGDQLWMATYQGPDPDYNYSRDLTVDGQGNVYVVGSSYAADGISDFTTVKYDTNGNELWVARYDGPVNDSDHADTVCLDGSGNVYVGGTSRGVGDDLDIAVVKYDSNGNQQWVARYDGPISGTERIRDMVVDNTGNVYVGGESRGDGTAADAITIKLDINGNQLWASRYNGPGNDNDYATALGVDAAGNVYVHGESVGDGTLEDYLTIKYDINGNEVWTARYNGTGNDSDYGRALVLDDQANVYVTGESFTGNHYRDMTTIKYDTNGNWLWVVHYDGPANDDEFGDEIAIDADSNIYVSGISVGEGTNFDHATVKYDTNGNQIWAEHYDGPDHSRDSVYAIILDEEQNILICGYSTADGDQDFTTIKYEQIDAELGTKCTVKAGKKPNTDTLKFSGDFTAVLDQFVGADSIQINIWSGSGFEYIETPIPFSPTDVKKGKFKYKRKVPKGEIGGVTAFQFDLNKQRFSLTVSKTNLNGLSSPLGVDILIGDYIGVSAADEEVANGKKPVPMILLRDYADSLCVDKLKIKAGKKADTDSLSAKGTIAANNTLTNPCAENIVVSWAGQIFTILQTDVVVQSDHLYTFRDAPVTEGGIASGTIDLMNCTFKLDIKNTNIIVQSGSATFGLAFEDFGQAVFYDL